MRFLPLVASFTKRSTDFQVKNLFGFRLPDDLPAQPNFRGLVGTLSTTTTANAIADHPFGSVTLFSIRAATGTACPAWGEPVDGYGDLFARFPNQLLATAVVKQSAAGTATFDYDFLLPVGIPLPSRCTFVTFDGTDFAGQPYTMASDLKLIYDTDPIVGSIPYQTSLDFEFTIGVVRTGSAPPGNAYRAVPIDKPGRLLSVFGNIGVVGSPPLRGPWRVRVITEVYTQGSCATAFRNHADTPFSWNDTSASAYAPTSVPIADVTLSGNGPQAINSATVMNPVFPVTVAAGDFLVTAILPADGTTATNGNLNAELQLHVERVDD